MLRGSNAFPMNALVGGAVDAGQRSGEPGFRVCGRLSESANRFVGQSDDLPGAAAVLAAVYAATAGVECPGAGEPMLGVAGVHDNGWDYGVPATAHAGGGLTGAA